MSIEAMRAVWLHSKAKGTHRLVMLAIADGVNDETFEGWFSGSHALDKKANCSERRVTEIVADLVKAGEVSVKVNGGPYRTNLYLVLLPGCGRPDVDDSDGGDVVARPVDKVLIGCENSQGAESRRVRETVTQGAESRRVGCETSRGEGRENSQGKGARSRAVDKPFRIWRTQVSLPENLERSRKYPSVDPSTDPVDDPRAPARAAPFPKNLLGTKNGGHGMRCRCEKCSTIDRIQRHRVNCVCGDCVRYGYYKTETSVCLSG
jgi:hypothetical protein